MKQPPPLDKTLYKIYSPLQTVVPHIPVHLPLYMSCQLYVPWLDGDSTCMYGQQVDIFHQLHHVCFHAFLKHLHCPLRPPHRAHIPFPHIYLLIREVRSISPVSSPPVVFMVGYFLYKPVTQHKTYTCLTCSTFSLNKLQYSNLLCSTCLTFQYSIVHTTRMASWEYTDS